MSTDRTLLSVPKHSMSCLKLVKTDSDDHNARIINSRMGMSVTDFLSALGSSSSSRNRSFGDVVWPKHTDSEVIDPWSAVYQYEPGDISWCVRFKALGCYNFVPGKKVEHLVLRTASTLQHLKNVSSTYDVIEENLKNGLPNDNTQIETLLKMRQSTDKSSNVPVETITPAERHKLWEDLLLSDSDDENDERIKPLAKHLDIKSPHPNNSLNVIESGASKLDVNNFSKNLAECNHTILPPPPFVSPLSVSVGEWPATDLLNQSPQLEHSSDQGNQPTDSGELLTSTTADTHTTTTTTTTLEPGCPNVPNKSDKQAPPSCTVTHTGSFGSIEQPRKDRLTKFGSRFVAINNVSSDIVDNQVKTTENVTHPVVESNKAKLKKHFIDRLLNESEELLALKDQCYITPSTSINNCLSGEEDCVNSKSNLKPANPITPSDIVHCRLKDTSRASNGNNINPTFTADSNVSVQQHSVVINNSSREQTPSPPPQRQKKIKHRDKHTKQLDKHHSVNPQSSQCGMDVAQITNSKSSKCTLSNIPASTLSPLTSIQKSGTIGDELAENAVNAIRKDNSLPESRNINCTSQIEESGNSVTLLKKQAFAYSNDNTPSNKVIDAEDVSSDRVNMPPPAPDSTGKRLKRPRSNLKSGDKHVNNESNVNVLEQCVREFAVNRSHISTGDAGVEESDDNVGANIYPLRDIPSKCWVFSDLALTAVRAKLQVFQNLDDSSSPNDMVEQMRQVLKTVDSIHNPNLNRPHRQRSLTGILLVPSKASSSSTKEWGQTITSSSEKHTLSFNDVGTSTSPYQCRPTSVLNDMDIQCDLLVSVPCKSCCVDSVSQSSNDVITPAENKLSSVSQDIPISSLNTRMTNYSTNSNTSGSMFASLSLLENQYQQLIQCERDCLSNLNASGELRRAEECKLEASRCWKSLVNAISHANDGNTGRSQLLLNLNALHQYPVEVVKFVRHTLKAAYLFEAKNELSRSADLLNEAAEQIQQCLRRMRRVEAKLVRRRNRTHTMNSDDECVNKPKRDAGWMHLWYYAFLKIKSVLSFHSYRARMKLIDSLREEIEADLVSSNLIAHSLKSASTEDGRSQTDEKLMPSNELKLNPQIDLSIDESRKLLESVITRSLRLNQLTSNIHGAINDWQQSNELACNVPQLHYNLASLNLHSTNISPHKSTQDGDQTQVRSIDVDIACMSGGAYTHQTSFFPIPVLSRYIEGLISVHFLLISQLKGIPQTELRCADHLTTITTTNLTIYSSGQINEHVKDSVASTHNSITTTSINEHSYSNLVTTQSLSSLPREEEGEVFSKAPQLLGDESQQSRKKMGTKRTHRHKNVDTESEITDDCLTFKAANKDQLTSSARNLSSPESCSTANSLQFLRETRNMFSPSTSRISSQQTTVDQSVINEETKSQAPNHSDSNRHKLKKRRHTQLETDTNLGSTRKQTDHDKSINDGKSSTFVTHRKLNDKHVKKSKSHSIKSDVEDTQYRQPKKKSIIKEESSNLSASTQKADAIYTTNLSVKRSRVVAATLTSDADETDNSSNHPASPTPPTARTFSRSKSLVPCSHTKSSKHDVTMKLPSNDMTVVQPMDEDDDDEPEDNTYKPKRIRSSGVSKTHGENAYHSPSSPDRSPTPAYHPSIPTNTTPNDHQWSKRSRRAQSVSLSTPNEKCDKTKNSESKYDQIHTSANASQNSSEDTCYSPTRKTLSNGKYIDSVNDVNAPVYRVSHITTSLSKDSKYNTHRRLHSHHLRNNDTSQSKNGNRLNTERQKLQASYQSGAINKPVEVPSFYARWINEPTQPNRHNLSHSNRKSHSQW